MDKNIFRIYKTECLFKSTQFIREVNTLDIAMTIVVGLFEKKAEDYIITFVYANRETLVATYFTDETQFVHDNQEVDFKGFEVRG